MRGSATGTRGAINRVDTEKGRIYIDGIKAKKRDGSEVLRPITVSNVMIHTLNLDDKKRNAMMTREGTKKAVKETKGAKS